VEIEVFLGVLGAVMIGNGMAAAYLYALFWGDWMRKQRGENTPLPAWWFAGAGIPPIIAAASIYVALY
jgi:hypothetical protein